MSKSVLRWFELHWPREVDEERVVNALRLLAASSAKPVILEAIGVRGGVVHRLGVPEASAPMLLQQMRAALPTVGFLCLDDRPSVAVDRAVEVCLSTTTRPLGVAETESVCRALLTALSGVGAGESVVLQWQLIGAAASRSIGNHESTPSSGSWSSEISRAFLGGSPPLDADARSSLRSKRSLPGWRVVGRIGTHAEHPARQRQLIHQVAIALRSAEAPGVRFVLRSTAGRNLVELKRPWRVPMLLNVAELAAVSGWPVGNTRSLPVVRQASRAVAPNAAILSAGRRLGAATFPGRDRPVALGVRDALRHLHVVGPTGVGKSTLLLNLICQDMAAGRAVVLVEPKGDLISEVLARVPAERMSDVVLIDPTDREAVVGVNPLAANGQSSELVADQLLGVFHHLYAASWGPRTSDILHASLLTLARTPGMSLASLPLLLSDAGFRRRIVGGLNEPLVLQPFWQSFDAWSDAERTAATAPVLNKVRPLLIRPSLRAVLGHVSPRFQLRQVFTQRKILLVNLAKGLMGPEAAALLGSIVVAQLWQTAQERSAISAERRHPVFLFVDEFQDYLNLPTDLADALAQARGLGIGLTLAHQHLSQLSPQMRSAVMANARSRVVFQLAAEDAKVFAGSDTTLVPDDFRTLAAFEAYAQLVGGDSVQPWFSLRTLPPPPASSDPDKVRALSRSQYATSLAHVDQQLQELRSGARERDLGPRRRAGGDK
jgi:hypothetical protein